MSGEKPPKFDLRADQHVGMLAMNGQGKTYAAQNLVLPLYPRQIVIDSEDREYPEEVWPSVTVEDCRRLMRSKKPFRVRYVVPVDKKSGEMLTDGVNRICLAALNEGGHDVAICFDEVTDFCDASQFRCPALASLARKGRKRNVCIICLTQRPQLIHHTILENTKHVFAFYMTQRDVDVVVKHLPFLADLREKCPMDSYKFKYWGPGVPDEGYVFNPVQKFQWTRSPNYHAMRVNVELLPNIEGTE